MVLLFMFTFFLASALGKTPEAVRYLVGLSKEESSSAIWLELALALYRQQNSTASVEGEGWFMIKTLFGCTARSSASLAQSAARQSHNLKVVSSSLTGGSFFFLCTSFFFLFSFPFPFLLSLSFFFSFLLPFLFPSSFFCIFPLLFSLSLLIPFRFLAYEQSALLCKRSDPKASTSAILTAQAMVAFSHGDRDTCKQLLFQG